MFAPSFLSPAFALHLKLTIFVSHINLISLCQSLAKKRLCSPVLCKIAPFTNEIDYYYYYHTEMVSTI
jgi:hypothetical protein